MWCARCQSQMCPVGSLIYQTFAADAVLDMTAGPAWRCPICGNYEDAVILRHRALTRPRAVPPAEVAA